MGQAKALITCCAILFGIDAFFCNGWYTTAIKSAMLDAAFQVYVRW